MTHTRAAEIKVSHSVRSYDGFNELWEHELERAGCSNRPRVSEYPPSPSGGSGLTVIHVPCEEIRVAKRVKDLHSDEHRAGVVSLTEIGEGGSTKVTLTWTGPRCPLRSSSPAGRDGTRPPRAQPPESASRCIVGSVDKARMREGKQKEGIGGVQLGLCRDGRVRARGRSFRLDAS